jgi:hypothetical protein
MSTELFKYFLDVLLMGCKVLGIDEDVIQIHDYAYVKHIGKDAVDETLESRRSIGKSLRHNQPFITFRDPDKVISGPEVNFGIDFGTTRRI